MKDSQYFGILMTAWIAPITSSSWAGNIAAAIGCLVLLVLSIIKEKEES